MTTNDVLWALYALFGASLIGGLVALLVYEIVGEGAVKDVSLTIGLALLAAALAFALGAAVLLAVEAVRMML